MEMKMQGNPEELYNMACTLMETGQALKEAAIAMGYEEEDSEDEPDLNELKDMMSSEDKSKRESDYKSGKSLYVDPPREGVKTDGEEEDSEEEDDSGISPIKRNMIVIKLKKKFGKK